MANRVGLCLAANEVKAMYMNDEDALNDRRLFVRNLGALLAQTREGIVGAELGDHELVTVKYNCGHEVIVNVNHDSYLAIIRDVCKAL